MLAPWSGVRAIRTSRTVQGCRCGCRWHQLDSCSHEDSVCSPRPRHACIVTSALQAPAPRPAHGFTVVLAAAATPSPPVVRKIHLMSKIALPKGHPRRSAPQGLDVVSVRSTSVQVSRGRRTPRASPPRITPRVIDANPGPPPPRDTRRVGIPPAPRDEGLECHGRDGRFSINVLPPFGSARWAVLDRGRDQDEARPTRR